jgi:probable F420-dependent oxidoreductase
LVPGLTIFQGHGGQPHWANDITTDELTTIVQATDELGFHSVGVPWHLAMPSGELAGNFGPRWPHSLAASGFILGATKRLKVVTLLVVPCEQPLSMAKGLATTDWISGGRTIPMLMTGYLEPEFKTLGVPYEQRGAIMDEYIEAMLELWTADEPRFHGKYVQFQDIVFEPKPAQTPLPLWFGGRTKSALRRIARHGSGWMAYATPFRELRSTIQYIREQPEFTANPRPLDIHAYFVEATHDPVSHADKGGRKIVIGNEQILEQTEYLNSIGVDIALAPLESMAKNNGERQEPIASVGEFIERLHWLAEDIMPAAAKLQTSWD